MFILKEGHKKKLKFVRADSNGEQRGPFEQYFKFHEIRLEKIILKALKQNGVVEKMSRTIEERIRYVLSDAKLFKYI